MLIILCKLLLVGELTSMSTITVVVLEYSTLNTEEVMVVMATIHCYVMLYLSFICQRVAVHLQVFTAILLSPLCISCNSS